MSGTGFTISRIVVRGGGKADAALEFVPGLNVVAGASNTGKTYAWQVIDFMFGAEKPPKSVSESAGYSYAMIELLLPDGSPLTLRRALAGGGAEAYAVSINDISPDTPNETLGEKNDKLNLATISGRLLSISGLQGKELRTHASGAKVPLSFRDVARLILVDEVKIITEDSPVFSSRGFHDTKGKSAFWLLLTGVDDSDIVTQEAVKDRKQRLAAEMSILASLLDDRESRFKTYSVEHTQLDEQRARLAMAIDEATRLVATRQSELDAAARARDEAWEAIETLKSKQMFLEEQISRLVLLERHYAADRARLESSLEAGKFFEQLPSGECPVCGHIAGENEPSGESDQRLREFQQACGAEMSKIAQLARELGIALTDMRRQNRENEKQQVQLQATLDRANGAIAELLDRKVRDANEQLSQLLARQAHLAEAAFTAGEVLDLRARYYDAENQRKAKRPRSKLFPKVGAAGTTDFCKVVEDTLRAWKFPFSGNVSWADDKFDLVIGGKNRGEMGKGYRAVTHAAFMVALMRYCRQKDLPHPGIVVIDSPLNPFKGADKGGERVNTDVQEAFYADLAAEIFGDQVIVFENTEPPTTERSKMGYTHFSGEPDIPRSGFFHPTSSSK